jgi:methionyl aminopeptidase
MIRHKSAREIELLAQGGAILGKILDTLASKTAVGVTGAELDNLARELIAAHNCTPAFLGYGPKGNPPFPAALCVSVNDTVVHGIPNAIPFAAGDIVGLDLGLIYQGLYLDAARSVAVGRVSDEVTQLLTVTREALQRGIAAAQVGNRVGDISHAVQEYVEGRGFGVVRALVGHGVGYGVHEDPPVPNFGRAHSGPVLEEGLVIAIEPMVTIGDPEVVSGEDEWAILTASGLVSAHEEDTVAITAAGPKVLTRI